jgi:tetrahydromethanopterin S-methyltransferase subunit A
MKKEEGFVPDPKGFFYIYVDKAAGKIVVEHYANVEKLVGMRDGDEIKLIASGKIKHKFEDSHAEHMYKKILEKNIVSRLDHAAYLGSELAKAEIALQDNLEYEQDKPLELR